MQPLATAAQMKELDRTAIETGSVPSLTLMENAAQAVAEAVWVQIDPDGPNGGPIGGAAAIGLVFKKGDQPPTREEQEQMDALRDIVESKNADHTPRVAVFCGPGNNGGDGVAAARLLMERGNCRVRAFFAGDRTKMSPDQRAMEVKLIAAGGALEDFSVDITSPEALARTLTEEGQRTMLWLSTCDCMVDALFGIGLTRPVEGVFRSAVQLMNHQHCPVVSCDIPSGLHADTGAVLGEAVRAAATVTFTCAKPGHYLGEGRAYTGALTVAGIGIPHGLPQGPVCAVEQWDVVLPRRPRTAHKGDFGRVFILAGSEGYTGAPVLAARGAVRTGAGLVHLAVPRAIYPIVAVKCDEAMPFPLPQDYMELLERARSCDAALIGPGLGRGPEAEKLVLSLLSDLDIPVVLDADGINALSGHIDILDKRSAPTVLTPHDGEFQRLTGCPLPIADRLSAARDFATAHRCILVLKGHATVTAAQSGEVLINTTGNPGMAKGGSGDVLAGMIASLWGQKHLNGPKTDRVKLAAAAVYLHGEAGDLCAHRLGEYGMTPGDLAEALPTVLERHVRTGI